MTQRNAEIFVHAINIHYTGMKCKLGFYFVRKPTLLLNEESR